MTRLEELRFAIQSGDQRKVELMALAAVRELERTAKTTWLTPIAEAYEAEMGKGSFPFGQGAKLLAPLFKYHPSEKIAAHLGYYIRGLKRNDEVRFLSLSRFVQTFDTHNPDELAFADEPLP